MVEKEYVMPSGDNACRISIHAVPRASKTELCGLQGSSLKLRLQAPPVDGKANKAISKFLAEILDIPARNVSIVAGDTGREKIFFVQGISSVSAKTKIEQILMLQKK